MIEYGLQVFIWNGDKLLRISEALSGSYMPSLEGVRPDGQPVIRLSALETGLHDPGSYELVAFLVGEKRVWTRGAEEGEISHLLLWDGEVVCARGSLKNGYDVLINGKIVGSSPLPPHFFQDTTGEVHAFSCDPGRKLSFWWTLSRQAVRDYERTQIAQLVETPDGVMAVTYLRDRAYRIIRRDGRILTDCLHYVGNFQVLPGQFVYAVSRDNGGRSLVAGKRCQPCFDRVSPVFKRDGQWLYYGVTGGYIYTIEVPEAI